MTSAQGGPLEQEAIPDVRFQDALTYIQTMKVDVVNMSFGRSLITKGYDYEAACGNPVRSEGSPGFKEVDTGVQAAALTLAAHPELRGNPASLLGRLHATSRRSVTVTVGACGIAEGAARLVDAAAAVGP